MKTVNYENSCWVFTIGQNPHKLRWLCFPALWLVRLEFLYFLAPCPSWPSGK